MSACILLPTPRFKINNVSMSYQRTQHNKHSWLCDNGAYADYIDLMSGLNPTLDTEDYSSRLSPLKLRTIRGIILELQAHDLPEEMHFESAQKLGEYFECDRKREKDSNGRRRIFIIENLNTETISILGSEFYMDPSFFVEQTRKSTYAVENEGLRMTEKLPSLAEPSKSFKLQYSEARHFYPNLTAADGPISALASNGIVVTEGYSTRGTIAIVHRSISFWARDNASGGWDVVILCDPSVTRVLLGCFNSQEGCKPPTEYSTLESPYQGGFRNFTKLADSSHIPTGPSRVSMFDDLCYYFSTHFDLLPENRESAIAAVFAKKIVASHYLQLIRFIHGIIADLEWRFAGASNLNGDEVPLAETMWRDLIMWNTRCAWFTTTMEENMLNLGIKLSETEISNSKDWMSSDQDYQLIYRRLQGLQRRMEGLIAMNTSLAALVSNKQSMLEAKRSVREAKSTKTLTLIGLVFIPLAFTCAILSMNEQYLPSGMRFWVYFAICIPLVALLFFVVYVLHLGYDDNGCWSFGRLWNSMVHSDNGMTKGDKYSSN